MAKSEKLFLCTHGTTPDWKTQEKVKAYNPRHAASIYSRRYLPKEIALKKAEAHEASPFERLWIKEVDNEEKIRSFTVVSRLVCNLKWTLTNYNEI